MQQPAPQPANHISQLKSVAVHVDEVEERHNSVVDVQARLSSMGKDQASEIRAHVAALSAELSQLREDIQKRIAKAKRASVLLSLIAQEEEFKGLRTRIESQQYEMYVDKDWFSGRLN